MMAAAPRSGYPTVSNLLSHRGAFLGETDAVALAPPADRPALDLPARHIPTAADRRAGPRPGAVTRQAEPELGPAAGSRRTGRPGLPGRRQHRVEDPAPGRR